MDACIYFWNHLVRTRPPVRQMASASIYGIALYQAAGFCIHLCNHLVPGLLDVKRLPSRDALELACAELERVCVLVVPDHTALSLRCPPNVSMVFDCESGSGRVQERGKQARQQQVAAV